MSIIVTAVAGAALVAAPASAKTTSRAAACAHDDARPASVQDVSAARSAILCLVNADRRHHHRAALRNNAHLRDAAQAYADAIDPGGPLVHVGDSGSTPRSRIAHAHYAKTFIYAEALGRSKGDSAAPRARVKSWLASASTRAVLRAKQFRDAGVGIAIDGEKVTFVVVVAAKVSRTATVKR